MRRNLIRTIVLTTALAAAVPAAPLAAQKSTSETTVERERQRDAERERDRKEREKERARVQAERARRAADADRDHDDDDDDNDSSSGVAAAKLDTTVTLGANGVVDLSLISGDIIVTGWNRPEAKVHATTEHGELRFEHSGSRLSLDVRSRYGRAGEARFELSVPEGTRVLMRSTSGDLKSHGVKGEVEARSVSGDVDVSDAVRNITIETVSGEVVATRLSGDVHGNAVSGDVELSSVTGDVEFGSVSGSVSLTDAKSRMVHLSSVSGDLTYQGSLDAAGRYEFGTHSGGVALRLPEDVNATVSVQTFNGEIDSDFKLTMQPASDGSRRSGRRMEFTLGRGGPRITAETFSGDITLERGSGRGSN